MEESHGEPRDKGAKRANRKRMRGLHVPIRAVYQLGGRMDSDGI
jgi:hypothetical protein